MASSLLGARSPVQWLPQMSSRNSLSRWTRGCRRRLEFPSFGESNFLALASCKEQKGLLMRVEEGSSRTRRIAATPNDETQKTSSSESREFVEEKVENQKKEQKRGLVEKIETEMGRQFGKTLWFTVLIICLAVFGGSYVYCIVNFANFDDIPILRGPVR